MTLHFCCLLSGLYLLYLSSAPAVLAADSDKTAALPRPKIGVALSGGGARGLAHIGVLQGFEELRVPVDYLAGTSMGSIVGGLYAIGLSARQLQTLAVKEIRWAQLLDNQIERADLSYRAKQNQQRFLELEIGYNAAQGFSAPSGFIDAQELLAELTHLTQGINTDFATLPIPFKAVATDLNAAEPYLLEQGNLAMALRASMAVPFAFSPVEIEGRILVDGGILNNIPVEVVQNMGANIVLAIDIETPMQYLASNSSFLSVTEQTIYAALLRNSQESLQKADIVITPNLKNFTSTDFSRANALIEAGYQAVMEKKVLLSLLSLSPSEYAAHLAQRQTKTPPTELNIRPDFIEFSGYQRTNPAFLQQQVQHLLQQPLDSEQINIAVNQLMAIKDLAQVTYRIVQREQQQGILFEVQEKAWGPNYFRFGINAATGFDDKAEFTVLLNHERLNIGQLGAEWINELIVGTDYQFSTEFYQPLSLDRRFFIAPYAKIGRHFVEAYQEQQSIGEYDLKRLQLGLDLGININNVAQLRTGFRYQDLTAQLRVGDPKNLPTGTVEEGIWHLRFDYDDLDHRIFATRGSQWTLSGQAYSKQLGAHSDYHRLFLYGRHHFTVQPRSVLFAEFMLGSFLKSEAPFYENFSIGGSDALAGYSRTEVGGSHAFVFRFGSMLNPPALTDYLPGDVRLLTIWHTGKAWDTFEQIQFNELLNGGSLALMWDTRLGAVLIGAGYTEGGELGVFLNLGNLYLRGFEFDR